MNFDEYPLHDSQRGWFGRALYFEMQKNPDLLLFTADLGWPMFDLHQRDFPEQYFNPGAAEQAALGAAIGATLMGKTCVVYSITSFLLYRPFEWIRNFLQHEGIPVHLVGSGLNDDYAHDGITHQTWDTFDVLKLFPRIKTMFPHNKEWVPIFVDAMLTTPEPTFLCLRR